MRKSLFAFALTLALLLVSVGIKAQTTYINEGFESWSTGAASTPASGWDKQDYSSGTSTPSSMNSYLWYVNSSPSFAHGGAKYAYLYAYYTYTSASRLKTPAMSFSSTRSQMVSFWLRNSASSGSVGDFSVYYSLDGGTTYLNNPVVEHISTGNVWTYYQYRLPDALKGQTVTLVFQGASGTSSSYYYYLDDVVVKDAPTCQAPIDPYINGLSGTGATLNWDLDTMGVVPDQYSVTLKDNEGTVVYYNPAVLMSGFAFTGLQANTTYTASVRSNCDVQSYQGFSDSVSVQFTTLAPAINPPFFEHFDSLTAADFPGGYYINNATLQATGSYYHSQPNSVKLTTTASDNAYIIFPLMNIAGNNIELDFWMRRAAAQTTSIKGIPFKIGYMTDPSDFDTFNQILLDSINGDASWRNYRLNSASLQDQTTPLMLCIVVDAGYATSVYIDDVDIHVIPSCTRPEHLTCSNVTDSAVTLSWDMANASSFLVKAVSADGVLTQMATQSPYTFTGLTQNTSYTFTVQGVCSAADSSDVSVAATAKTFCSVADSTLFFEGAETTSGTALPDCWTTGYMVNTSTSTANPFQTSTTQKVGTRSFSIPYKAVGTISYLCSQARNFDQSGKYSFRYKMYRPTGTSYNGEVLKIFVTPTPGDTTNAVEVIPAINFSAGNAPTTTTTGWNDYEGVINYQGVGYVMAVIYCKNGVQRYIDNLEVFLTPQCPKVTDITTGNKTATTFDIAWTAGGDETQWVASYQLKQGTTILRDTTEILTTAQLAVQNLEPATAYVLTGSIRALCGAGDTSDVTTFSRSFTTACLPLNSLPYTNDFESDATGSSAAFITCWNRFNDASGTNYYPYNYNSATYAHSGSKALYFYTTTSATYAEHQMAILPEVDTTVYPINTLRLKFWAKRSSTSSYADAPMIIGVMTDPADLTTFVAVDTLLVNQTTHQEYTALLDNYTGNGTYIAIRLDRQTSICYCYLDDVTLEEIPNCFELDGSATVSDIDTVSAKVTLADQTATSAWSYAYGPAGTSVAEMTAVDTTGSFIVLTGLTPATKYDLYVRRNCGSGEYSPWSAVVSFVTSVVPATVPYICGFEDAAENANWITVKGANTYNNFVVDTASIAVRSGNKSIYQSNDNGVTNAYNSSTSSRNFAYRTIHFDAKGYQIDLDWRCAGGEGTPTATTIYDYARIMLYPASEPIPAGASGTNITSTDRQAGFPATAINLMNTDSADCIRLAGDDWHHISKFVNMTAAPGDYNLVLAWNQDGSAGTTAGPLAVDDISISELNCIPPVNIATTVADTTVTLSVVQATASQWEFIVDTVAFTKFDAPAAPLARIISTDGTATLTGLTPNTEYWYSVRTICGIGDTSAWLEVASLRTYCSANATPFSEGFETVASALCWSAMNDGTTTASVERATAQKHSGLASLKAVKATVISPEFAVDSLTHYMITGYAYSTTDSAQIHIGVIVDPNDASTFEQFTTLNIPVKNTWTEFTAYFTALLDPDNEDFKYAKNIAINCGGDNTVYFDDIVVDLTPTCPKPNEVIISNITANSFDITFTDNASASQWVVYTNGTPHVITSTTATISGLNAHTNYAVGVAAICSAADTSLVTDCGSVTTLCDKMPTPWTCGFESNEGYVAGASCSATTNLTVNAENNCWNVLNNRPATSTSGYPYAYVSTTSNYVHSGSQGTYLYSSTSGNNLCLIFPEFSDPSNMMKVNFWYKNSSTTTTSPQPKFGYFTDPTSDTSFVAVESLTRTSAWTEKEYFTNTASYNIPANARLGILIERGTAAGALYVDDISVTLIRNCSDPEAPTVSNVTAATADVAFSDTAAAHAAWEYVYGPAGFNPNNATPVSIDTTVFTISGLNDDTDYDVYVRAVCGVGDVSNYIKASFRTLCLPFYVTATTPFSEDFNSYNYNQYLSNGTCYTLLNQPASNSYWAKAYPTTEPSATATTYYNYGHSADRFDKCVYWSIYKTQLTNGSILRQFHLDGGQTYEVSAWVRNSTTTSYQSKISAMVGETTATLDTITSLVVDGATIASRVVEGHTTYCYNELYQQLKFFVTPDSTGDYFIGYNVAINNTSDYTYLYLDDWTITPFQGCSPAVAVVDSATAKQAYISIEDSTYYQFEYVLNDTTLAPTVVDTTHFVIDSLNSGSAYTIYLRKYCDATTYSQWFATSFRTDCGMIDKLPYTNDFEDEPTGTTTVHTAPFCWSQYNDATSTAVGYPYVYSSTTYAHSGTKLMYFYASTTTTYAAHQMSILPPVDTTVYPLNNLRLRFWASRSSVSSYADAPMIVGVMSDPTDITTFVPVETLTVNSSVNKQFKVSLANYSGTGNYIAIRLDRQSATCYCYLDDVTLEEIPPCEGPEVAPTVASTTMTTMTVLADMAGKDSIEFGLAPALGAISPVSIDTTIISTDGSACFTGLTGSTNYAIWYRYYCGVYGSSTWSTAYAVGTTTASDCFAPQNLRTVGLINDHHVAITWGKAPEAVAYEYELKRGTVLVDSVVAPIASLSDTIVYDSLTANTQYTFRVRTLCATDTSAWQSINFTTTYPVSNLPFICGFENAAQNANWQFRGLSSASATNQFAIGNGISLTGSNALYVSNDGATYAYTIGSASVADAEVLLEIPAGNYYVSYDWQCKGEGTSTFYDYGRFFLIPSSVTVTGLTYSAFSGSLPAGAISLDNNHVLNQVDAWTNYTNIVSVPNTNVYKLVAVWANDASGGTQPPLAIDNIRIEGVSCMPLNSVSMITVNSNDAQAVVSRYNTAAVEYALSIYDVEDSISAWSVATGDTLSFTSLVPGTNYHLFARHSCDSASKSPATMVSFLTPNNSVQLPFVATFEANDTLNSHWTLTSGASLNWFTIGSATSATGSGSLYITDDGSNNNYTSQTSVVNYSYAYIPIQFPAGQFDVSYQWACHGESTYDFGHLFLVPSSMIPEDNVQFGGMTYSVLPTGAIALDSVYQKLNSTDSLNFIWYDASVVINMANAGTYNLVAAWRNDGSVNHQNPLALDNIRIKELTCPKPDVANMSLDSSSTDMFRLKVLGAKPGSTIIYHVATDASFSDTIAIGETAINDSLFTVTGLSASTWYYAHISFKCGVGDTSALATVRIRTNCATVSLPYDEDFESYVAASTQRTQLDDNCWNVTAHNAAATPTTANTPYYYMTTTSTYVHGGSKALYIYNLTTTGNSQTFAMPMVDSLAGMTLSLWYRSYGTTTTYADLEVGYLSDPESNASFVLLTTAPKTTTYSEFVYTYPATIPTGARPAFRANGTYYLYVDDIHLNKVVQGPQYNETLCFGSGYSGHGFTCAPGSLAPGDTTLNATIPATVAGVADSIITVNLHVLAEIVNNFNDTICEGQPYNRGLFNISDPETKTYFRTFQGASVNGCDSTVNLNLYVVPTTATINDTICQGDAYQFGSQTLTQTGTYYDSIPSPYGCMVYTTLNLLVVDTATYTSATICNGDNYEFEGQIFNTPGIHVVPVVGPRGCVINKSLNLSVIKSDSIVTVSFCTGGSVQVADTTISTPGTYTVSKFYVTDPQNPLVGCTMTYHITATQDPILESHTYDYACEGHPYYGYGVSGLTITNDTVIDITTRTLDAQCDSLSHVHLTFKATTYSDEYASIVPGDTYRWNDEDFTEEGDYPRTYQSAEGCDSVVTLHLTYKGSGVDNISDVHMTIVPNPVNAGATTFVYGEFGEVENVEILNNFGQVIDHFSPQSYPIEVSGISASGLYYVRVTTKTGTVHLQKLIVK